MMEKFEMTVDTITAIRKILGDYPYGDAVLFEFLQNADDAGACSCGVILETFENRNEGVSVAAQSPALLFHNNSVFTEGDLVSISNIGGLPDHHKRTDVTKVGQFGIGFRSAFHLTDMISFVTGEYLVLFDPLGLCHEEKGFRLKFTEVDSSEEHPAIVNDLLTAFEQSGEGFSRERTYEGTLFRFVLRTKSSKMRDEIHEVCDLEALVRNFHVASRLCLLLQKNVRSVNAFIKSVAGKEREHVFSLTSELLERKSTSGNPADSQLASDVLVDWLRSYNIAVRALTDTIKEWRATGDHGRCREERDAKKRCMIDDWVLNSGLLPLPKAFCERVKMNLVFGEGECLTTTSAEFCICHQLGPGNGWTASATMHEVEELATHPGDSPLVVPWAAIIVEDSKPATDPKLLSFFPTKAVGHLPVHIHSYFKIPSDRQSIFPVEQNPWNRTLCEEVIPFGYATVLEYHLSTGMPTYALWPSKHYEDSTTETIAVETFNVLYEGSHCCTWANEPPDSMNPCSIRDAQFLSNKILRCFQARWGSWVRMFQLILPHKAPEDCPRIASPVNEEEWGTFETWCDSLIVRKGVTALEPNKIFWGFFFCTAGTAASTADLPAALDLFAALFSDHDVLEKEQNLAAALSKVPVFPTTGLQQQPPNNQVSLQDVSKSPFFYALDELSHRMVQSLFGEDRCIIIHQETEIPEVCVPDARLDEYKGKLLELARWDSCPLLSTGSPQVLFMELAAQLTNGKEAVLIEQSSSGDSLRDTSRDSFQFVLGTQKSMSCNLLEQYIVRHPKLAETELQGLKLIPARRAAADAPVLCNPRESLCVGFCSGEEWCPDSFNTERESMPEGACLLLTILDEMGAMYVAGDVMQICHCIYASSPGPGPVCIPLDDETDGTKYSSLLGNVLENFNVHLSSTEAREACLRLASFGTTSWPPSTVRSLPILPATGKDRFVAIDFNRLVGVLPPHGSRLRKLYEAEAPEEVLESLGWNRTILRQDEEYIPSSLSHLLRNMKVLTVNELNCLELLIGSSDRSCVSMDTLCRACDGAVLGETPLVKKILIEVLSWAEVACSAVGQNSGSKTCILQCIDPSTLSPAEKEMIEFTSEGWELSWQVKSLVGVLGSSAATVTKVHSLTGTRYCGLGDVLPDLVGLMEDKLKASKPNSEEGYCRAHKAAITLLKAIERLQTTRMGFKKLVSGRCIVPVHCTGVSFSASDPADVCLPGVFSLNPHTSKKRFMGEYLFGAPCSSVDGVQLQTFEEDFGWRLAPSIASMCDYLNAEKGNSFEWRKQFFPIYSWIEQHFDEVHLDYLHLETSAYGRTQKVKIEDLGCVPHKEELLMATGLPFVKSDFLSQFPKLCNALQVRRPHPCELVVNTLSSVARCANLDDAEVDRMIALLTYLVEFYLGSCPALELHIPTADGGAHLAKDVTHSVATHHSRAALQRIVHPKVSTDLARKLNIKSETQRCIMTSKLPTGFQSFGQKQSITKALQSILTDYSDHHQILLEMLQNADDAGAEVFRVYYDKRDIRPSVKNPDELLGEGMKQLMGPAILVYNDRKFSESDMNAIADVGNSCKAADRSRVGRFGRGFNSVYHLTESPTLITGNHMLFLDPSLSFLSDQFANVNDPGLKLDFVELAAVLEESHRPHLRLFDGLVETFEAEFTGSIFRFPLRTKTSPAKKIGTKVWTPDAVDDLFTDFARKMPHLFCFLHSISKIEVVEIDENGRQRTMHKAVIDNTDDVLNFRRSCLRATVTYQPRHGKPALHAQILKVRVGSELATHDWLVTSVVGALAPTPHLDGIPEDLKCKLVPTAACAFPLQEHQLQRNGSTSCFEGRMHCFLPLPFASKLPYHVHGLFALSSSRREMWTGTLGGKKSWETLWNTFILHDVVPCCVLYALKLRESSDPPFSSCTWGELSREAIIPIFDTASAKKEPDSCHDFMIRGFYEVVFHPTYNDSIVSIWKDSHNPPSFHNYRDVCFCSPRAGELSTCGTAHLRYLLKDISKEPIFVGRALFDSIHYYATETTDRGALDGSRISIFTPGVLQQILNGRVVGGSARTMPLASLFPTEEPAGQDEMMTTFVRLVEYCLQFQAKGSAFSHILPLLLLEDGELGITSSQALFLYCDYDRCTWLKLFPRISTGLIHRAMPIPSELRKLAGNCRSVHESCFSSLKKFLPLELADVFKEETYEWTQDIEDTSSATSSGILAMMTTIWDALSRLSPDFVSTERSGKEGWSTWPLLPVRKGTRRWLISLDRAWNDWKQLPKELKDAALFEGGNMSLIWEKLGFYQSDFGVMPIKAQRVFIKVEKIDLQTAFSRMKSYIGKLEEDERGQLAKVVARCICYGAIKANVIRSLPLFKKYTGKDRPRYASLNCDAQVLGSDVLRLELPVFFLKDLYASCPLSAKLGVQEVNVNKFFVDFALPKLRSGSVSGLTVEDRLKILARTPLGASCDGELFKCPCIPFLMRVTSSENASASMTVPLKEGCLAFLTGIATKSWLLKELSTVELAEEQWKSVLKIEVSQLQDNATSANEVVIPIVDESLPFPRCVEYVFQRLWDNFWGCPKVLPQCVWETFEFSSSPLGRHVKGRSSTGRNVAQVILQCLKSSIDAEATLPSMVVRSCVLLAVKQFVKDDSLFEKEKDIFDEFYRVPCLRDATPHIVADVNLARDETRHWKLEEMIPYEYFPIGWTTFPVIDKEISDIIGSSVRAKCRISRTPNPEEVVTHLVNLSSRANELDQGLVANAVAQSYHYLARWKGKRSRGEEEQTPLNVPWVAIPKYAEEREQEGEVGTHNAHLRKKRGALTGYRFVTPRRMILCCASAEIEPYFFSVDSLRGIPYAKDLQDALECSGIYMPPLDEVVEVITTEFAAYVAHESVHEVILGKLKSLLSFGVQVISTELKLRGVDDRLKQRLMELTSKVVVPTKSKKIIRAQDALVADLPGLEKRLVPNAFEAVDLPPGSARSLGIASLKEAMIEELTDIPCSDEKQAAETEKARKAHPEASELIRRCERLNDFFEGKFFLDHVMSRLLFSCANRAAAAVDIATQETLRGLSVHVLPNLKVRIYNARDDKRTNLADGAHQNSKPWMRDNSRIFISATCPPYPHYVVADMIKEIVRGELQDVSPLCAVLESASEHIASTNKRTPLPRTVKLQRHKNAGKKNRGKESEKQFEERLSHILDTFNIKSAESLFSGNDEVPTEKDSSARSTSIDPHHVGT